MIRRWLKLKVALGVTALVALSMFLLSILSLRTVSDYRSSTSSSSSSYSFQNTSRTVVKVTSDFHFVHQPTNRVKKTSQISKEHTISHLQTNSVKNYCHGNDTGFPGRFFLFPGKEFQCHKDQEILVIVRSDSREMRDKIRDTWGDNRLFGETRTKVVFAVLKLTPG